MDKDIVWFKDVSKEDVNLVGGKGANLGELFRSGIPVPNGFIVTANTYYEAVRQSGTIDRIRGILFNLDRENPTLLESKAIQCQKEILKIKFPQKLENQIEKFYTQLSSRGKKSLVAVRSSATAEDLPGASFAGQQATFLNVRGENELKEAILSCWASLFNARAIFYREEKRFDHFKVGIAVPVQKMVESEVSGIMFTVDPISSNKNKLIIEAVYGLGEMIVSGQTTPDHYEYDKKTNQITQKTIVSQKEMMVKGLKGNKIIPVSRGFRKIQKLPDDKVIELAKIGIQVEKHYYFPQDLEWALQDKKLYIVQSRPITTLKEDDDLKLITEYEPEKGKKPIVIGAPASPSIGSGPVVIIKSPKELSKVKKGDVLVAEMTNPDYVPAMRRASAIVTDKGGRTSHAAIVSRELGIACVVGTENATKKLKNGMVVTVNGAKGFVYLGLPSAGLKHIERTGSDKPVFSKERNTATHVYVNLAEPHLAAEIASKDVDGIGLLRAEFILAQIGKHPKEFLKEKKGDEFTEFLAKNLEIFAKNFGKRPVIYRASDLKSNEYRNLIGGDKYEPAESNPMLGYRGAFRYIKDPDAFKLELNAIKKVRVKRKNLHLMIPFVRSVNELIAVRALIEETGLFEDPDFKFWMMVEIPVNVILLEEFIKAGIDGVSIGSNDLTMLILGTDRDNEEVASEFNELSPAVLWALEKVIKTCHKNKITASICGQAPSVFPELTEKLVSWGITSISVNPDAIENTRNIIYRAEEKLLS